MNDAFNYIAVLVSIVLGLCATQVMSQMSEAIQAHRRKRTYWVHTVWMVNLFLYLMLEWWVFYRWHNTASWNFFLLIWVIITPTLLYLAAGVLCPGELVSTDAKNWREYYYANRRGFFFILALLWPIDVVDTLLKGKQHFLDKGPLYLPTLAIWTTGTVIAGITSNERYHQFWAIFFPIAVLSYTTLVLFNLG